jgi:hypothetical protein
MRLSEALRFSTKRQAEHPGIDGGLPITGSDYGISCMSIEQIIRVALTSKNPMDLDGETIPWSEMQPLVRKQLLQSELWEPIEPKPCMLIIAEAASDWTSLPEPEDTDDDDEEEGYYA